ncbi:MAG: tetratricopeptide repeat protein [Bacteroidales bacterium]|nr:tetratricopeptide repeat protein [Bacteroidales bacterium]
MKTTHLIFFILSFIIQTQFQLYAQKTEYYGTVEQEVKLGRELFMQGKYNSAFRQFEKVQKKADPKSEIYSEAIFYKSVSALKSGNSAGYKLLGRFIEDYPESPYIDRAWLNLGDYQFEHKHYQAVLQSYSKVDRTSLNPNDRIQFQYRNGYSHLMMENNEQALREFTEIKDANNLYSRPATYYYAHIMYLNENYQSALEGFTKLNDDPVYSRVIPIYVSHIFYKQQKYNEIVNYTVNIIDDVEEEHKSELSKITGDSYFHLREYDKALPYLEYYYNTPSLKTREDNYILGYCYYHSEQFQKAVPLLENASQGKDEMAQNAYYHLADSYIKLNDKEKARVAFEAASEFDFNERIKEDALFSYAKLTYELSYSPFNETIKAFDRYITLYPNSQRNTEAYRYLTEVFMVTRNNRDAISSIEKIEIKTSEILKAYQRVTFYHGMELFNNLAYNEAIDYFDLSLQNGSHSRELNAKALYWKAEALYRVGNYGESAEVYSEFLRTAGSFSLPEYSEAEYNLGYSRFKLGDYSAAASHFRNYINSENSNRTGKLADAYNRLGDYHFLNSNYSLARQNYQQAYDMNLYEPDYSLYQIAFCMGLEHNQQAKINSLERLLSGFPDSDYSDDAYFELGRAHERLGQISQATKYYSEIISSYKQSIYYPKALLQMGLISFNSGDFNQALTNYKQVAENFSGTPDAQAALLGIKNCYVEMNNVDAYFAYTRTLGGGAGVVTTSEQDSLIYMSAERLYMSGDPKASEQLQRYLREFPDGSFVINTKFYLAELYYKEGSYSLANDNYTFVAGQPNNIFSEQALSRASELTYNAGKYEEALDLFNRLESLAGSKWNTLKAYTGQMRCNFELKRYSEAVLAAGKVKNSDAVNEAWIREADFIEGKSEYLTGQFASALEPLKKVASDTKLAQGAESKYLIADIYYKQNQKKQAEDEIMEFVSEGTPFQFWLGKSFLLLSDIYIDRNDEFQAKHTLRSVVENYGNDEDGIKEEAARKLAQIETREQQDQQRAKDSSFQLKLN